MIMNDLVRIVDYQTQVDFFEKMKLDPIENQPWPIYKATIMLGSGDILITYMSEN